MPTGLTYEQWLAALSEAEALSARSVAGALTGPEWCLRRGAGRHSTDRWIREGLANGWLECVRVPRADRTGIKRTLPAYRLVGPAKSVTEGRRTRRS